MATVRTGIKIVFRLKAQTLNGAFCGGRRIRIDRAQNKGSR